jgi:hypothetical protein
VVVGAPRGLLDPVSYVRQLQYALAAMNTPDQKPVNLALELRSGRHYGVFIDDTGSPGLMTPGLHTQRKSG